jgi:alkyldihydroxyacetonephosphate synthase
VSELEQLIERLPAGAVSTHPGELLSRSRDWWSLSMLRESRGDSPVKPAAVAFPTSTEEVATVLQWATETMTPVIPRGAGSGVSGGATPVKRGVVLDLTKMTEIRSLDTISMTATVQAGIRGDRLEQALELQGLTLGHYPQSLAISTVGGWIAAFSAGQASSGYGGIEDLVLGLTVVLADGTIVKIPARPRSAAGPSLSHLFIGSEGTFGVVTEAVVALSPLPSGYLWDAYQPSSFEMGLDIIRRLAQRGAGATVIRLYDEPDATLAFHAIGHQRGAVMIVGFEEDAPAAEERRAWARRSAYGLGAVDLGGQFGQHWWEHRNDAVETYRKVMGPDRMLGAGVMVDTMEVAGFWSDLPGVYQAVKDALAVHAEMVGCHVSHAYSSGASLYFTFLLRDSGDIAVEERYLRTWAAAVESCHVAGGTMTHHHGVGLLKTPFLEAELGPQAYALLKRLKTALDPNGILNPGKLFP